MEINKKLHDDIKAYCRANNLKMTDYINKLLRDAFNIDRYGTSPFSQQRLDVSESKKEEKEEVKKEVFPTHSSKDELVEKMEEVVSDTDDNNVKLVEVKSRKRKLK